jgi:hypothetical protein
MPVVIDATHTLAKKILMIVANRGLRVDRLATRSEA